MANNTQLIEKITTARVLLSGIETETQSKQDVIDLAKNELETSDGKNTDNQLIEKVVKAKLHLKNLHFSHANTCLADADPDYTGPCRCGADKNNSILEEVRKTLDLS